MAGNGAAARFSVVPRDRLFRRRCSAVATQGPPPLSMQNGMPWRQSGIARAYEHEVAPPLHCRFLMQGVPYRGVPIQKHALRDKGALDDEERQLCT